MYVNRAINSNSWRDILFAELTGAPEAFVLIAKFESLQLEDTLIVDIPLNSVLFSPPARFYPPETERTEQKIANTNSLNKKKNISNWHKNI